MQENKGNSKRSLIHRHLSLGFNLCIDRINILLTSFIAYAPAFE